MRRAAVACRPSWATLITSSVAIRLARAPYGLGPSRCAARTVKAYVATFMTAIATAIPAPLRSRLAEAGDRTVTPCSVEGVAERGGTFGTCPDPYTYAGDLGGCGAANHAAQAVGEEHPR